MASLLRKICIGSLALASYFATGSCFAEWSQIGGPGSPGYGGISRGATIGPDGSYYIFSEGGGGVFKSTDSGSTWSSQTTGLGDGRIKQVQSYNVGSAVRFRLATSGGYYRSDDSGATFQSNNVGLLCSYATAINVFPKNDNGTVLLGTGCQSNSGVYKQNPADGTWNIATGIPTNAHIYWIGSVWTSGSSYDYLLTGTDSGLYKSMDSGSTWNALPSPSGPNGQVIQGFDYSYIPTDPTPLILMVTVEGAGIFRSVDQGQTWTASTTGLPHGAVQHGGLDDDGGKYNFFLTLDGSSSSTGGGVYKSTDRGSSWTLLAGTGALPSPRATWPTSGANSYFSMTHAGPYKSSDGGVTWYKGGSGLPNGWTNQVVTDGTTGTAYAAAADGVYSRPSNGQWTRMADLPSMVNGQVALIAGSLYATTTNFGIFRYDPVNIRWNAINNGLPSNLVGRNPILRADSSTVPAGIYLTLYGNGIYYSADGGTSWTARNVGLSGNTLKVINSAAAGALVYISTETGVYKSTDQGLTWSFVFAPKDATGTVNLAAHKLLIDQTVAGVTSTVYATVFNTDGLGKTIPSNGVWKSTDSGVTWLQLPSMAGRKVNVLNIVTGKLVVGTWDDGPLGGAFGSTDGGVTWVQDSVGLTNKYLSSVAATTNSAFLTTKGGGIFGYSDTTPWIWFGTWSNGGATEYYVDYGADDPSQQVYSGVNLSGGGLTPVSGTFDGYSWDAELNFNTTAPSVSTQFTGSLTTVSGGPLVTQFSIRSSGFNSNFPTNIQPSGGVNIATSPVFTWSPPLAAGTYTYGVDLIVQTPVWTKIWQKRNLTVNSITYDGPLLVPGTKYIIQVRSRQYDSVANATYDAMRAENFCYLCGTFDQTFIGRNINNGGLENYGVSFALVRSVGDNLASYSIVCPNSSVASGNLQLATNSNDQWINVDLGSILPVTPFDCTVSVTKNDGTSLSSTAHIDSFAPTSYYPTNVSIVPNSNLDSLSNVTFTPPVLPAGGWISANVIPVDSNGNWGAGIWFNGNATSPINFASLILTPGAKYVLGIAGVSGNPVMHAAQTFTMFCYQCGGVTLGTQSITFGVVPTIVVGGTGVVSAVGGASGNAVIFTSMTPTICSVSGTTVAGIAAGTCTIAANQAANAAYSAATQVTQNISVNLAAQTIGTISFTPATLNVSGTTTVSANGGASGNPVTFTSTTTGICTVSGTNGSTVMGVAAGTCTIAADQAGNANYGAAIQVTQNITVGSSVGSGTTLTFVPGWNLVGNSVNSPLTLSNALPIAPSTTSVSTVWKWLAATSQWAFYSPTLADGGVSYAQSKGYIPLTVINGGEGFWVNAKAPLTLQLPQGPSISSTAFADQPISSNNLSTGWSLIATGDNPTPKEFVNRIAVTPPSAGTASTSLTSLWAWDSTSTSWYFYAPSLDNAGTLASYTSSKGYFNFSGFATTPAKTLDPTTGFWVNHP